MTLTVEGITINNVENYGRNLFENESGVIVARYVDGEWWYWGAWKEFDKALAAAQNIGGQCFFKREAG